MVNVVDNEARNRTNMIPVGIKIIDDKGNTTHTAKTDLDTNYISLESKWFGSSSNNAGGSTGGNTGGNTGHPTFGDNYYAGSLADGEITERNLEWAGIDNPANDTTIKFNDDPGLKPFGQYTGLTILGHIQKTVMTAGIKGAVSTLDLNYDPSNTPKAGYFTTTASYPNYVKSESLVVGNSLSIPMNGVGENLSGGNIKSPEIQLTYNADKTLTIKHIQGYVNDGNTSGATGANYDYVVDIIATFSVQPAVAQIPPALTFFTGSVTDNAALSGMSNFYENSMGGIEITLDDYLYDGPQSERISIDEIGINKVIRIPKEFLIINNKYQVPRAAKMFADDTDNSKIHGVNSTEVPNNLEYQINHGSDGYEDDQTSESNPEYLVAVPDSYIEIGIKSITLNISIQINTHVPVGWTARKTLMARVDKVTSYQD